MTDSQLLQTVKRYTLQLILVLLPLSLGFRLLAPGKMMTPALIALIVMWLFYMINAGVWYWVTSRHADYLPSFFTGTSVCRFLLALTVVGIYYLATDKASTVDFLLVFVVYYVVTMLHHSIYFTRVHNRL